MPDPDVDSYTGVAVDFLFDVDAVQPLPRVRRDSFPEYMLWRDTGCAQSPSCLSCPLVQCVHDLEPREAVLLRTVEVTERVLELRGRGLTVVAVARELGLTPRTVFRHLALVRETEVA